MRRPFMALAVVLTALSTKVLGSWARVEPFTRREAPPRREHVPSLKVVVMTQCEEDPLTATGTLRFAGMLLGDGDRVVLFLNEHSVSLVDLRVPRESLKASMRQIGAEFRKFVSKGGRVVVCPHCARQLGLDSKHLAPSAVIGSNDEIVELLETADRVFRQPAP